MTGAGLDNPFWTALTTAQRDVASGTGPLRRYPADIAPFFGVADATQAVDAAMAEWAAPGETLDALGICPRLTGAWHVEAFEPMAQMVCEAPLASVPGPPVLALGADDVTDVQALTALVYPHYFRARTMSLGRYFGIRDQGRLVAMLGERVATPDATEISAICTHPDFVGRGCARRLIAHLVNDLLARGRLPFLHVAPQNTRAFELYRRLGFRVRARLGFWAVRRAAR